MTENDYIAEYIKEKWPDLLGIDFAIWKMVKVTKNWTNGMIEAFKSIDIETMRQLVESGCDDEKEEDKTIIEKGE